jgi:hypothetical protein
VVVQDGDLRWCNAGILEFERGAFLAAENDDVFAFYADGAGSCAVGSGLEVAPRCGW